MNRIDQVKKHLSEYERHMNEGQYPRAYAVLERTAPGDIAFLLSRIGGMEKKLSVGKTNTGESKKILRRLARKIKNSAASNVVEMEVAKAIDDVLYENAELQARLGACARRCCDCKHWCEEVNEEEKTVYHRCYNHESDRYGDIVDAEDACKAFVHFGEMQAYRTRPERSGE